MVHASTPQFTRRNRKASSAFMNHGTDPYVSASSSSVFTPRTPPISAPPQPPQQKIMCNEGQAQGQGRRHLHAPEDLAPDSNSTSSTLSPGTPFRFETFPASLPRVNPRKGTDEDLGMHHQRAQQNEIMKNENQNRNLAEHMHIDFSCDSGIEIEEGTAAEKLPIHKKSPFQSPLKKNLSTVHEGCVRKRMAFAPESEFNESISRYNYQHSLAHASNNEFIDSYRDDSQNTSLSSLSVDGASLQNNYPGKLPPTAATPARMHPHRIIQTPFSCSLGNDVEGIQASGTTGRAVWMSPILSDEKQKSTMSNTEAQDDLQGLDRADRELQSNARTRLNFNTIFTPTSNSAAINTFRDANGSDRKESRSVARKRHSFNDEYHSPHDGKQSIQILWGGVHLFYFDLHICVINLLHSKLDATPARKMADRKNKHLTLNDRQQTNSFPPPSGDPIRPQNGIFAPFQIGVSGNNHVQKLSPMEENFRLYLDNTQCSPIKSVPEDGELPLSHGILPEGMDIDIEKTLPDGKKSATCIQSPSHSTVQSTQSGQESTCSTKSRKLRPMPDISAFDMVSNATLSSIHHPESLIDPGSESGASSRIPLSPMKVLCPPTPLRTPAWVHKNGFERSNSLVSTKVLAACPARVIDGFSSLENSLIDDEKVGKSFTSHLPPNNSASIVESFREDEEDQPSKLYPTSNDSNSENEFKPISKSRDSNGKVETIMLDLSGDNETSKHPRLSSEFNNSTCTISFNSDFDNIHPLGSGAFADVYKARSKENNQYYALKKNRRQFRGRRDRDRALAEIRIMQRLQTLSDWKEGTERTKSSYCLYVLFFIRAWQEDGHLFCQTELCCRDTCHHLMLNMTSHWELASKIYPSLLLNLPGSEQKNVSFNEPIERLVPENTIWKICHDVACGLSHIHTHNIVHHDIKPLNIFFVCHAKLGALCKIGDFGMAGETGTSEDGQEGDAAYMPNELLRNAEKSSAGDIFSLGITLYELASSGTWVLPAEGTRWHTIREASHEPEISKTRSPAMVKLIKRMISPNQDERPKADEILTDNQFLNEAAIQSDKFLADYIRDVDQINDLKEKEAISAQQLLAIQRQTPTPLQNRNLSDSDRLLNVRTPTPGYPFS